MVCVKNTEGFELIANSVKFNSAGCLPEMSTQSEAAEQKHRV